MWHLLPTILYLACVQGHHPGQLNNPYSPVNSDRSNLAPYSNYRGQPALQAPYNNYVSPRQYPDYPTAPLSYNYPAQRQPQYKYIEDPYNAPPYNKMSTQGLYYNMNDNNLRESETKPNQFAEEVELDYSDDPDMDVQQKLFLQGHSYSQDLELVEDFGKHLKRRTFLNESSTPNDPAHQYNALLAVIIALARIVGNSCADYDQVYDQVYLPTVGTYFKYGLKNADKVAGMIEDYIKRGKGRISKIVKLKQKLCEKELFCSVSLDNKIKASPLWYRKELLTLEALSNLARSYYDHVEEFNKAAEKRSMLPYLQNSKERLREYVMHAVNSIEHISNKPVKCT